MATNTNSKNLVICPECEGGGYFGPGFVWTQDDIAADPEGFEDTQRLLRGGYFDTPCQTCKGQRVVEDRIDHGWGVTTAAERWEDEQEYRAEVAAEQRYFGGGY